VIYTTNAIEAVHRQFRKLTKTKGAFPNENSLLKLLYMGIQNASQKWTMPLQNWNLTLSQLSIYFDGRLDDVLDISTTPMTRNSEHPLIKMFQFQI
jgi:transposase-like protein